jgi:hypothetical protein
MHRGTKLLYFLKRQCELSQSSFMRLRQLIGWYTLFILKLIGLPRLSALQFDQKETISHLLTSCAFCRLVWFAVLSQFGVQEITPSANNVLNSWLLTAAARMWAKVKGIRLLMADLTDSGESGISHITAFFNGSRPAWTCGWWDHTRSWALEGGRSKSPLKLTVAC